MLGWTDSRREITERQSVVESRRTGTNQRAKLPGIGRAGGSGHGFGRASLVAASLARIHIRSRVKYEKETKMAEKKETKLQSGIGDRPMLTEDEIRKRAYEMYCARSGGPGSEVDDWLKAETELKQGRAMAG
ncbi:MAG TPA: DUF2934 domain-containing protein [Candidatus Binataceae bacterium]|nr:DUF2934 domain-containing protein [Candidatus Binataceae bacterium]